MLSSVVLFVSCTAQGDNDRWESPHITLLWLLLGITGTISPIRIAMREPRVTTVEEGNSTMQANELVLLVFPESPIPKGRKILVLRVTTSSSLWHLPDSEVTTQSRDHILEYSGKLFQNSTGLNLLYWKYILNVKGSVQCEEEETCENRVINW